MAQTTREPATASLPDVMKVPQVAAYLRCDPATVYALIHRGDLPVVRVGRTFRVTSDQLRRFVEGA